MLAAATVTTVAHAATDGQLQLQVVDSVTGGAIPVRMTLTNARGRAVRTRDIGVGALGNHFYLPGEATLGLRRGGYLFSLDAGPEYRTQQGNFEIERYADDIKTVEMRRFANLEDEGWYAADVDSSRAARHRPIVAATEGLHCVPTIAWHFADGRWQGAPTQIREEIDATDTHAQGRYLAASAAYVEFVGGALLLVSDAPLREPPLNIAEGMSSLAVMREAHAAGMQVISATPTAWDLPVWIASGDLDAVCLLTRQTELMRTQDKDPTGRPRDRSFYPGQQGLARWGQAIYFHLLNSGIRIAPVAGSGSGVNESPLGTNRTYVHLDNRFSKEAWWRAVASGATVVTNGPLLRPSVGGDPPGSVFRLDSGETIDFEIALNLASRDPVEYLEVIKNGEVDAEVRLRDWASKGGRLPPVSFVGSGWFAVRAATASTDKYQFALTAPYYVESPDGSLVSKQSVEFFLAWIDELESTPEKSGCTAKEVATAQTFWRKLRAKANAP